jgi:hypothetical protein
MGLQLGRRLTVVRLGSHRLWLHASLHPSPLLLDAIRNLGRPTWIIGPNAMHDDYLPEFAAALPEARLLVAPALARSNRRLRVGGLLSEALPAEWGNGLQVLPVRGAPAIDEYVFLHQPSGSLILADLAFNLRGPKPWFPRRDAA